MKRRRELSEEKKKRSVPFLPNFITTMSLFCGFYSIMFSLKRDFHWAAILILIAGFIGTIFISMVLPIFTLQDYIK